MVLFQVCTLAMQFTKANPCEVESIREQKKKKEKKTVTDISVEDRKKLSH